MQLGQFHVTSSVCISVVSLQPAARWDKWGVVTAEANYYLQRTQRGWQRCQDFHFSNCTYKGIMHHLAPFWHFLLTKKGEKREKKKRKVRHMSSFGAREHLKRRLCASWFAHPCVKNAFCNVQWLGELETCSRKSQCVLFHQEVGFVAMYNDSHDTGLCDFSTRREAQTAPPRHSNIVI